MKKLIYLTLILLLVHSRVYAEPIVEIRDYPQFGNYAESISKGENPITPNGVLRNLYNMLFGEILRSKTYLATIMTIAAAAGLLRIIEANTGCTQAAYFTSYSIMSASVVKLLSDTVGFGTEVIHSICDFITKLAPIFLGLIAATGKMTSAAAFSPILSGAVYIFSLIVDKLITPTIYLGAVLGIVGNISGRMQLGSFNSLLRSVSRWILTALLTVFASLCALYGFNAPVLDALGAKTAKFAVGTLVPVVGGLLADTMETVVGGTRVLKNAVGSSGMICVIIIAAAPVIKVWVIWFLLRLSAALCEPLCDKRMTMMLSDVSDSISTVLAVMLTAVMLFIITIAIMLLSTGG